jgi:superfamily II DNA or RNA helicase
VEPRTEPERPSVFESQQFNFGPGSIVKLRSRLWRIDDLRGDTLTATSIDGTPIVRRRFFLPFEKVIPGRIEPPSSEIVGNYSAQDLLLRAYRLSMIHGTAPLLSLQRSRVVPESFQMVPVIMSLEMPRVRMLIADDVGLGKTIEAGLIATELFARQRASRLLVICPANLREQWKEALDYFFHIDARIISSRHRRAMERELPPGTNPWEYYPFLIVSMDYAKTAEVRAQILEQKDWDIVLVDEAHNVAKPHQVDAGHKIEMERWELLRDLAKRTRHLLMLTATPHNGYTDTFASLLAMLDVGAVSGPTHDPLINREIAKSYVCQRRRKDLEEEFKKLGSDESPFPKRDQNEVYVPLSPLEGRVIAKVEELGRHILTSAGPEHTYRMRIAKWTVTHFHKRALSSPRALIVSLRNRLKRINRILGKEETIEEDVAVTEEEARAEVLDNDTGERTSEEEVSARMARIIVGDKGALNDERRLLEETLKEAERVTPSQDSKLNYLLDNTLREMYRRIPKVIIFSKYKDTVDYLAQQIPLHRHYRDVRIVTLDGSLDESQRKERFREFEIAEKAVMIATDCISEGINLQYVASQIIHYELPWNPNRLEQRNGRIDRYGQPERKVYARTMVVNDSLEAAILKVLVQKAMRIREDHGFSPPFFGDDMSVLDLIREHGYEVEIGQTRLSDFLEGISPQKKTLDPFSDESIQKMKNDNFYGQSEIDLSEIRKRLKETESIIGSQKEIQSFVRSGLNKFGCEMTSNPDGTFKIVIRDNRLTHGFDKHVIPRATFDPLRGRGDPDLDVIDLGHPLVRNLIELVKQQTFAPTDIHGRTACVTTKATHRVSAVYTFLARYAVHTNPISVIEELLTLGLEVYGDEELSKDEISRLLVGTPEPELRTSDEMKEDLTVALSKEDLDERIRKKAGERCQELVVERQNVKKSLEAKGEREWLEGIDRLSVASVDLLCVTVYYPALGGLSS